jgi:hypothetical protein
MKPVKGYFARLGEGNSEVSEALKTPSRIWTNIPLLVLVLGNMAPIYGVVVFGWDAFYIFDFLFIIFNFSVRQGMCRFAVVDSPQASSLSLSS